jgi:hypothetical protein
MAVPLTIRAAAAAAAAAATSARNKSFFERPQSEIEYSFFFFLTWRTYYPTFPNCRKTPNQIHTTYFFAKQRSSFEPTETLLHEPMSLFIRINAK